MTENPYTESLKFWRDLTRRYSEFRRKIHDNESISESEIRQFAEELKQNYRLMLTREQRDDFRQIARQITYVWKNPYRTDVFLDETVHEGTGITNKNNLERRAGGR